MHGATAMHQWQFASTKSYITDSRAVSKEPQNSPAIDDNPRLADSRPSFCGDLGKGLPGSSQHNSIRLADALHRRFCETHGTLHTCKQASASRGIVRHNSNMASRKFLSKEQTNG